MRVECPCGQLIKNTGNPSPQFADLLPSQSLDDYCDAVENAIRTHSAENAAQYVVDETVRFFRQMCQCSNCGRLFVESEDLQVHEFVSQTPDVPTNLLAATDRN